MPAYPDDSGSGSEYEDEGMRPPRKRGKGGRNAAPKRPRHDTMESNIAVEATLFEIVRQGKMAMVAVVDDWIEAYKANRNGSLLDLIQFFIHASGCKGTVTAQMLREATEGFQDVIKRMTEEFDEDSGDYPLIAAGTYYRKFRSNFCDFVQALVRQCQYQIIYDQYMMDNVLTLLTELSNSQVRAFRHTSTLAAMKLMTGLVNVALGLSVSLDNTQRQYDAERNKALNKRASEKLDILLQKRKELEEQQSEIENMLNGIFKGIFVHRYRDYIADIRALCMEEIGTWMKMFPKVFLTDSYLKYVGWTLHDKQKEVRLKCLNTLIGLYADTEMTRDLKLFTSRFKDRIVSMTLDKEYDVAVLAIKLLVLILVNCGYDSPVLTSGDSESVYQLVFSCHRPVAIAAAEFLNKQLFADKDVNPGYTKRGRRRSPNAPLISDLVMFFIESELHEHATYLVDSLWEVAGPMLKDWECMSDMLLEEPANDRDALDERQESALVDIMVCSVKQASDGVPPSGRQGYSKKTASRDRKTAIEDKVRLTEHFIVALPNLLKKFHVDKEKVACLLQIPRYFDLEFYTTSRLEKHLDDLLAQMAVVVDKHTDSDVLEQASNTYCHLCDEEYAIYSKVSVARRAVIDTWVENFNLALGIFKEAGDEADEEEIYNVVQGLKRLTNLYMYNDMRSWDIYSLVNSILQMHQERPDTIPEPMLRQAVKFIYYDLVYALNKAKELSEGTLGVGGAEDPRAAISQLRQRVTEYLRSCEYLLTQSPHKKVQEECYMSICDLLVMFAPQLANSSPTLKPLVQRASDSLQHALIEFVKEFVFVATEDDDDDDDAAKIDALHRRRSLLANVCKLFVFCMMELRLAAYIFQQYIRFYSDYGDIIKETISRSRHIDKLSCAKTLALSLMSLYQETVRAQGGHLDYSSQEYGHMKELARRFALTFGLDQVKTRDAVAELHKEGILFALRLEDGTVNDDMEAPPNLSFLGILVEFSAKLMKQDKKTVVQYLDRRISRRMLSNQDQSWIPLVTYRNSLLQGADDEQKQVPTKGRRGRRRKVDGDFDAPQTPRSPATPMQQPQTPMTPQAPMTPQNTIGHPQLSSTIVRGMPAAPADASHIHMQDESAMQYQPYTLQAWLNSGKKKNKKKTSRGSALNSDKKNKAVKKEKQKTSSKAKKPKDHYSEDEGFVCERKETRLSVTDSTVRRSTRKSTQSVHSYAENSDDDFSEMPPATWGSTQANSQVSKGKKSQSTKKNDQKSFKDVEEELQIGEFEESSFNEQEFTPSPRRSSVDVDADFESSDGKYVTEGPLFDILTSPARPVSGKVKAKVTNPFESIVSTVKDQANTSLAEMFEEAHITDVESSPSSSGEDFLTQRSSFYQTPEKRRRRGNLSSDSGVLSSPRQKTPSPGFKSKRKINYALPVETIQTFGDIDTQSKDAEESDISVDEEDLALQLMQGKEELDFRRKDKEFISDVDILENKSVSEIEEQEKYCDDADDDFGAFNDVMQSFFMNVSQRSQSSQNEESSEETLKGRRSQTIVNNPMGMSQPQHSIQTTQDYQQQMHVGYPMSAPQASPMPQMATPQHPPPQYMHPGTSSGMYHQGGGDPFQGVMSPMQQQQGMQSQQQYFGN